MKKRVLAASCLLVQMVVALALVAPSSAQGTVPQIPDAKSAAAVYIVQLIEDPVVAYEGGIAGIPATRPARGQKINPNDRNVRAYVAHLQDRHNQVLNAAGAGGNKLYDYVYTFNGFAAKLSPAQAATIAAMPGVVSVAPDEVRQLETDSSPDFLGLTASGGLWEQVEGVEKAGEGMIVGVIDTGIWPEHPSFLPEGYGPPPADWYGGCDSGEEFSQKHCNNKLIGARFYRLGANAATVIPQDYLSPRDKDGHGTHTASTAAGNYDVQASILGSDLGPVSGMAPRARVAAYKVCWNNAGCFLSDIVKAVDTAVADGVDVINYSIGGGPSLLGADDVAFLFAERAGVFVATSAGNSGPGAQTVGGPATVPWITAVGASTQERFFQGTVTLGDTSTFTGASITGGTDMLTLVDAEDAGSELCYPGELDPAVVTGKIVLCQRGVIARVAKSQAVSMAGGVGTILYNAVPNDTLNTDNHYTPTVHVDSTAGEAIKAYIDTAGNAATAQLTGGEKTFVEAPDMASFSSRGPNAVAHDIIKPDVTAPGVNILAGNTPNPFLGAPDQLFQAISGTSMSSPHVAGVAALVRQLHPDWTPAMVKSALMTSAYQDVHKEDGTTPADPFDMGGGHISPNDAANPGLVYDAGFRNYLQFLCGAGELSATGSTCTTVGAIDPSDLNLASIGIADLAGVQTVTRTVTNVGPAGTYNVTVSAPPGIDVVVNPSSLALGPGDSASYQVTFTTAAGATFDEWAFGSLTWSDGSHNVYSPLAVRPVKIAAPSEVAGGGTEGSLGYDIAFGYAGDFAAAPHGLIPATTQAGNVLDDPSNSINAALGTCTGDFPFTCTGITWHTVEAPAGTEYVRISLFDEYTDGNDDLDLYVFELEETADGLALGAFVGGSGSATSNEEVNVDAPAATKYAVAVHGWQTDGADANYTLFSWSLGATAEGNLTVNAPTSATLGASATIEVDWSGLTTGTKYLGSITHHDVAAPSGYRDGLLKHTIVRIDTD